MGLPGGCRGVVARNTGSDVAPGVGGSGTVLECESREQPPISAALSPWHPPPNIPPKALTAPTALAGRCRGPFHRVIYNSGFGAGFFGKEICCQAIESQPRFLLPNQDLQARVRLRASDMPEAGGQELDRRYLVEKLLVGVGEGFPSALQRLQSWKWRLV